MTTRQNKDATAGAERLADYLDVMAREAQATRAGENNGDASSVNEVVQNRTNRAAAEALEELLEEAIGIARTAPTVDDGGSGDGPLHPDFLSRLEQRCYPRIGLKLVVEIDVDDDRDTLKVRLLSESP